MALFVVVWLWYLSSETNIAQRFMDVAIKAFDKENYTKAIPLLLRALKSKKNSKAALLTLSKSYSEMKNYAQAKETFEKLLKLNPKDFDTLSNYAQMLQADKKNDEAKEFYNKALIENPKSVDCHFNLGVVLFSEGGFEKALESFGKAQELAPTRVDVSVYIVKCKDEICSYETAEEGQAIIDEYLNLAEKPNLPTSYGVDLAKAYAKNGQINEAFEKCKESINANDKDIEGYKLMGLIQLLKNEPVDSKNHLSTAISIDMRDEEVHNILSYVLCQHDDRCIVDKCRQKYHEKVSNLLSKK
jgi:Tfp pilus assembly protein PilF